MAENKNNLSHVKRGMNRNTAPYLLEGMEYLFALNSNIQDDETSVINITNEESNVLAVKFKEGFKVIGKKNDILSKATYFFLVNPETEESELGVIRNNQIEQPDILDDLEEPLENVEQQPYQVYESLIEKGLSLDITKPVKKIIIKNEQCGKVMAFTDDLNPPRLIVLNKLEDYLIEGKEVDPEKIAIFKRTLLPKINVKPVVTGGRLKRGTYEFLVAYTNRLGEEISEYTSITQPIPIFDSNNVILEESELNDRTNYAIKLELSNLDPTQDYYKVVVIQNTGATEFFVEGIHPISDTTVIYATEENKERTSITEIGRTFPYVKRWKGLTESSGHLIGYGITQEKEINLQPVINLMGPFLKWQTSIARETLYQSPDDVSLSKGYMRDETYPFSIRFTLSSGYRTALFPFIGRPADYYTDINNNTYHETDNVPVNKDSESIIKNTPAYAHNGRTKYWQFYNTATKEGDIHTDIDYTTVREPVTRTTLNPRVGVIPEPDNYIRIKIGHEEFTSLEDFLEDNNEKWYSEFHPLNFIYEAFNIENYPEHLVPEFTECTTPVRLQERDEIIVGKIENEELKFIEREIGEYLRIAIDANSHIFEINNEGRGLRRDEAGETETARVLYDVTGQYFYERVQVPTNLSREYAIPLHEINLPYSPTNNTTNIWYTHDAQARWTLNEMLTDYKTEATNDRFFEAGEDRAAAILTFYNRVSTNALWFRDSFDFEEDIKILEIPKYIPQTQHGEIFANSHKLRVSIFNDCSDEYDPNCSETDPILVYFVDPKEGDIRELIRYELQGKPKPRTGRSNQNTTGGRGNTNSGVRPRETGNRSNQGSTEPRQTEREGYEPGKLIGNNYLVAIDTPIGEMTGTGRGKRNGYVSPGFNGKWTVHIRPIEYGAVDVMFDEIVLDKRETYRADCNFRIPNVEEFEVEPYQFGKFSYVESEEKYPDNKELFDSTSLKLDLNKIPEGIKDDFKKYYIKDNPDGSYQLNEEADFTNKPIRHFKFPNNDVAPFMSQNTQASFSASMIFPIGIHIDDEVVSAFLDIAVDNDLLTQEQRDSIIAYEIFRGDRTLEKSIEAKGLLYDNYKYKEEEQDVLFSNFPYNSLGDNALLYTDKDTETFITHPYDSEENDSFSFISPDNQFRKLPALTELNVEGYQFGNSKSYFADVEDHPKWVILGSKGYKLATQLATAEAVAEIVIQIAEATIETSKNMWFTAGITGIGGNPVGTIVGGVATGVIAGFQILANSIFKVARYRHEWLTTFRNLGQPENFASYYTGTGYYNSLMNLNRVGNTIRGINTIKEVGSGRYSFRHKDTGEKVLFNNKDREKSTYIYLGKDFKLEYPEDYAYYDNYSMNHNYSSRPIASEEFACGSGQSREIVSNIASPYVSLKNYNPQQYGTINSIKWLPTSHISYFEGNKDTIFGGDIYISRMTMKRKVPLFLRDAMRVADLTPFNYGFYSNIGDSRFYVNYEVSEEVNLERTIFPDFRSDYNMDCTSGENNFYLNPTSKFYLYYYGIVDFLVESDINVNFRYGKKEPEGNFYPNIADVVEWTQERNVSIKENNSYFYNFAYSRSPHSVTHRTLPFTYSKEEYDCRFDSPNGAMWSTPDNSEKDLSEPWTVFRPFNSHNFPASFGGLTDLKGIENERVLGRFENQTAIFNAVDVQVEGISPEMGTGSLFARRPITFTETDLGYLGSKTTEIVSNEYGHFFPDAERGQIFRIEPSGGGIEEISKYSGGKPNGMDKWFKNHLPFKVKKPIVNNYENIDTDNSYNGIGITMGWDTKNKRVFITKKDYIPLQEMNYENGHFFAAKDEYELITDYEADGYTYLGKEGYYYKFSIPTVNLPSTAPIFVLVNVNSYTIQEAREIKAEVLEWKNDIPNYTGEVIFIATDSDRWINTTSQLIEGSFNDRYNQGQWSSFNTYTGQGIDSQGIVINFTNTSYYNQTQEPTGEFITDYTQLVEDVKNTDYLKTIVISKDTTIKSHMEDILTNEGEYRDVPVPGTSPQLFVEALNTYGVSYLSDFNMDTERYLNDALGDAFTISTILVKGDIIDVTDTDFFKDVSWTIAYSVETGEWISYYSFKPNYYIGHNTYFQSGVNNLEGKEGLWSHNMSNKSYSVFYGEKYPWIIEYPIRNEFVNKRLQNVTFWTEAKKHIGDYDYSYDRNVTFDHAVIYNSHNNSGKLNLIPQKSLSQLSKYPITREDSQDILITNQDYNWTFNNIYNRTLNEEGQSQAWINDENQIDKTINKDLVQFGGKKILSYLRGDYFIVRLSQTKSTQHDITFKWATNQEEIY